MTKLIAEELTYNRPEQLRAVYGTVVRLSQATGVFGAITSTVVLYFIPFDADNSRAIRLCVMSGVATLLCVLSSIRAAYFNGIHRSFLTSVLTPITSGLVVGPLMTISILGQILLYPGTLGIESVLTHWIISLTAVLLLCRLLYFRIPPSDSLVAENATEASTWASLRSRDILVSAVPLVISQVLFQLQLQLDLCLGCYLVTPKELGELNAAKRIASLIDLPVAIGNLALGSTIAELYSHGRIEDLKNLSRRTSSLLSLMLFFPCLVTFFFGDWFMMLFFGTAYSTSGRLLFLLMLSRFAYVLGGPCEMIMTLTHGGRYLLTAYICGNASILICMPILTHFYGVLGLAVSSGVGIATSVLILCYSIYKRDGYASYASLSDRTNGVRWWVGELLNTLVNAFYRSRRKATDSH